MGNYAFGYNNCNNDFNNDSKSIKLGISFIPCNCNKHSNKCNFDKDVYKLSGGKSGGVCRDCNHNTDGRYCNYCKEGYYRDQTQPIHSRKACKPCACDQYGSRGRVCNQTTGQCTCKEEIIAGLNQFADVKECPECHNDRKSLTVKRYCKRDYAVKGKVLSRKNFKDWAKFEVSISEIYKQSRAIIKIGRTIQSFWVTLNHVKCRCPKLRIGREYLILMRGEVMKGDGSFILDHNSYVTLWNTKVETKLIQTIDKSVSQTCGRL
ncbi:uncharacterized protein TRIADDRAFT_53080 [Trichoplax adhaerens]|uniref:NTR domain-containing protein n=1 Tax=Trichoplax adhaerens TaxID=10228 RepID=B3RN89_TRIAD|nr:hypothetical protein TRIADDRAFT_53080 [Trichoplax adhaerens]EDV27980.1 hypothetical protein TRIADDRAFT_53080 [Trichoplax adhaerens]|eukprot:XP_002109814.1 hypothetical protein TRIADDRAFT_53080 [Trichoplax adhaerens]